MSPQHSIEDRVSVREYQRFLDTAIHHLRAPLRVIATSAALLSEGWDDRFNEPAKALFKEMFEGVTRIDNLAKSLAKRKVVRGGIRAQWDCARLVT